MYTTTNDELIISNIYNVEVQIRILPEIFFLDIFYFNNCKIKISDYIDVYLIYDRYLAKTVTAKRMEMQKS